MGRLGQRLHDSSWCRYLRSSGRPELSQEERPASQGVWPSLLLQPLLILPTYLRRDQRDPPQPELSANLLPAVPAALTAPELFFLQHGWPALGPGSGSGGNPSPAPTICTAVGPASPCERPTRPGLSGSSWPKFFLVPSLWPSEFHFCYSRSPRDTPTTLWIYGVRNK